MFSDGVALALLGGLTKPLAKPLRRLFLFYQAGRFGVARCKMGPAGPRAMVPLSLLSHHNGDLSVWGDIRGALGTLCWQMRYSVRPWQVWLAEAVGGGRQSRAER